MEHTYTKRLIVVYLKFRLNWMACVLSGSPRRALSVRDLAPSLVLSWEIVLCFFFDNILSVFSLSETLFVR